MKTLECTFDIKKEGQAFVDRFLHDVSKALHDNAIYALFRKLMF